MAKEATTMSGNEREARRGGQICFSLGALLGGLCGWAFSGQPLEGLAIGLSIGLFFGGFIYLRDRRPPPAM
ncbi:MAG: hypothetical protein EXS55_00270 [Candidatus Magasanikbacteria bacterium]|nr:hypothetical protein [Candidatus Magasanikbacteria bacterium]